MKYSRRHSYITCEFYIAYDISLWKMLKINGFKRDPWGTPTDPHSLRECPTLTHCFRPKIHAFNKRHAWHKRLAFKFRDSNICEMHSDTSDNPRERRSRWARCLQFTLNITVTSKWARSRLKFPASPLFTQSFIQTQIKENIILALVRGIHRWILAGIHRLIPAQMVSNAENVSIWWRHHGRRTSREGSVRTHF